MSFARFLTWLIALTVTGGATFVIARYGFSDVSWGVDAVWAVFGAIFFTRKVHEALIDMWSRPGRRELLAEDEEY